MSFAKLSQAPAASCSQSWLSVCLNLHFIHPPTQPFQQIWAQPNIQHLTTAYYSFIQLTTAYYSVIQLTSAYYSLLQLTTAYYSCLQLTKAYCSLQQLTTAYCKLLQLTTAYYNLLQFTTTYNNLLVGSKNCAELSTAQPQLVTHNC